MTKSALEEKRKSYILKSNETKNKRRKHMRQ